MSHPLASRDRELAGARARKLQYRGTCRECGASTTGCNGRAKAPEVCGKCAPLVYGLQRRGRGPVVEAILGLLASGPTGRGAIIAAVGISPQHACGTLNRLVTYGLVERVSRGVYQLASRSRSSEAVPPNKERG